MMYLFVEIFEFVFPIVVFLTIIGLVLWGCNFSYKKAVKVITGNIDGKLTYEQKKSVLNIIKILAGAQAIGLLFYITPALNENIKILLSILITIGTFIGAFFIQEKNEHNALSRVLVFLGQEFFGITMILLMVNKGIGYSMGNILAIWTVFNFGIYKIFNKAENKVFLIGTLLCWVCSLLITYSNELEIYSAFIGAVVILLAIHFFGNKESKFVKVLDNFMVTILSILALTAVSDEADGLGIIYIAGLIYMVTILISKVVRGEYKALKALLVYIPYVVILLLSKLELEIFYALIVFNVLACLWILADKSMYKKVLCAVMSLFTVAFADAYVIIDGMIGSFIYIGSLIFVFTYLFAPDKQEVIDKGGVDYEE